MHKRKDIILNQTQYKEEIIAGLKSEFKQMKKELAKINSKDPVILAGKKSLIEKSQKLKVNEEINKLLISWKNITPQHYAWWDEIEGQVLKLKYSDNVV